MQLLRQSTIKIFRIGPFVDKTDGAAAETGLTIAQADIQISKDGGAFAQTSEASPTTTHDVDGWYPCPLTATDTATLGLLDVQVAISADALPVWRHFMVVPANVFDAFVSGSDALQVDAIQISGDATAADNLETAADGGSYNLGGGGVVAASVTGAAGSVTGSVGSVLGGIDTTGGTITTLDALDTAQDTQHSTTQSAVSGLNDPTAAAISDAVHDEPTEDHVTKGTTGRSLLLCAYAGSDGPGIYVDSNVANTNTVLGTDGIEATPVSTFAAARTLADALGVKVYYVEHNSDITLAATHADWEFIGLGSMLDNIINLGSQDVSLSLFRNLTIEGTQGGSGRITARDCALQDPGAGDTTMHLFAERCGIVDRIQLDTSADNHLDQCYSLVVGTAAPIIQATGASGTISITHWSGGIELESLSASHNVTYSGVGDITFASSCNVNATVDLHGTGNVIDNTAGMAALDQDALINMPKIDTWKPAWDAEVQSEVDDALIAKGLDHLVFVSVTGTDIADNSIIAKLVSKETTADWDDFVNTTDSLQAQRDNIGTAVGASISADLAAVKAETVLIVGDTNELQGDWTNGGRLDLILDATATASAVTSIDTNVDSILALLDNARTEPAQGAPPVNPDMATKIDWLYKAWRNKKTQTATVFALYADDASTVDSKATVSDDGTTTTVGEIATGP